VGPKFSSCPPVRFFISFCAGTLEAMKKQFHRMINKEIRRFLSQNREFLGAPMPDLVDGSDGINSLLRVIVSRQQSY